MEKNPPANAGDMRHRFDPCVGKIPGRRAWQPTPVLLPGNPIDRGAWWAAVHGVTQSQTRQKPLSTHAGFQHGVVPKGWSGQMRRRTISAKPSRWPAWCRMWPGVPPLRPSRLALGTITKEKRDILQKNLNFLTTQSQRIQIKGNQTGETAAVHMTLKKINIQNTQRTQRHRWENIKTHC